LTSRRTNSTHLLAGDGVEVWLPLLVFSMFVIVSWALSQPTVGSRMWGSRRKLVLSLGPFRSGAPLVDARHFAFVEEFRRRL
jgi:hypothetical protein